MKEMDEGAEKKWKQKWRAGGGVEFVSLCRNLGYATDLLNGQKS